MLFNKDDLSEVEDEDYKEDVRGWFAKAEEYSASLKISRTLGFAKASWIPIGS